MVVRGINIPKYHWHIDICYDVRPKDAKLITDWLYSMGCAKMYLHKAYCLLKSGVANEGLTYSDRFNHHTLIAIGHTTSVGEFVSTLVHEVDHLTDHISQYYGIGYASEENSYLIGDIAKIIYEDAINYLTHRFTMLDTVLTKSQNIY